MKLSEMQNKRTGLPDGFTGARMEWKNVAAEFQIRKLCLMRRDAVSKEGEPIYFQQGPRQGQPIPDDQVVMQLETREGKNIVVRTNSRRLTSLFNAGIEEREPDAKNIFGDRIYEVEAPEGWLRFIPFKMEYKDGTKGDIADLEEVD